ncbi:MAG: nickel-responsive transcriptional regulator NikR [Planctomycetota bacterium]|nr:MAG: nickel-responsive transcriptional regulator NikR [Planctomycetota bacterium]
MSIDRDLLGRFDAWLAAKGFPSRSAAMQRLIREELASGGESDPEGIVVATVSFVYDHHARELLDRLTHLQHQHLDLVVSSTHVHLDHSRCLEVLTLRGPAARVQVLGDSLVATRGVERGSVVLIPIGEPGPGHGSDHRATGPAWHAAAHGNEPPPRRRRKRRTKS